MNFLNDKKYKKHIADIIGNSEFRELENIPHHGESRFDHCLKVSYCSYKIARFLRLDTKEIARGALLHDFFLDRTKDYKNFWQKLRLYTVEHPGDAVKNAEKVFTISMKEKDIIRTHMFPFDYRIPKYLESWIVSFVDTYVSIFEFTKKFSYQINTAFNIWLLLFVNFKK